MRHRHSSLLLLAAVVGIGGSARAQSDQGLAVVQRASTAYQALTSFQAEFRQHLEDKMLPDLADSRGMLYQEGKNLFAMRFSDPPHDFFCVDGNKFWMYLPSSSPGQVLRFPLQNHPTYGTNVLGTLLDNAPDRYRVTYQKSEIIDNHVTDAVLMEPISNDMPFKRATVWFDRDSRMPRKLDIEETRDHRRILTLSRLLINGSIPPSTFSCKTPIGTKIIDQ